MEETTRPRVTVLSPLHDQREELSRLTVLAAGAAETLAIYTSAAHHDPALAAEFQKSIDATTAAADEVAAMIAVTEGTGPETAVAPLAA
jgi:hypothetical protein